MRTPRPTHIPRTSRLLSLGLVLALVFMLAPACAPIVGDACETQSDCGTSLFCERSMPDGYCTLKNCEDEGCPDEGVCIRFSSDVSWCMQPCSSNTDCRGRYTCVTDFGVHAFCNDARANQN